VRRRVSIIAVTYHSAGEICEALASARAAAEEAGVDPQIIVVDNASSDRSAEAVEACAPGAVVIRNSTNVGFGSANNQAFDVATGDPWLLLNPDARLEPDTLGRLIDFYDEHPAAAFVAPSIAGGGARDDSFERGAESAGMLPGLASAIGHFFCLNRLLPGDRGGPLRGFQLTRRPRLGPRRIEWGSAAVLLLRPAAIRQVAGFDSRIFLYGEDVDLGDRLGRAGWQAWLVPTARAWHTIASSQAGVSTGWVDGLHGTIARRSGRLRLVMFDLVLAVSLLARAAAARDGSPAGRLHRRRMRASGERAASLAIAAARHGPRDSGGPRVPDRTTLDASG
jgi:N-acetylglucosaminyl-diphospho-decaprenol L-rhamnosyltransferase